MAFKKKENIFFIGLLIVTAITLPLVATQNIDCKGKAFYCVNSTHFKICVDLGGGVSTTIDDFLIPCPKSTVCRDSNYFECEYHPTTTLKPTQLSEVTNDQISEIPILENFDFISTFNGSISDIELSEVIISTTPAPDISSTTLTIDSVIDSKNVTSVISDSATDNNINTTVTKVSLNDEDLLSTTTEKVILDNTELNFTKPINYTSNLLSSEKIQSTDNNVTGASLNTYLASDVTEVYTKNKNTLFSNTLTNQIDEDNFNHISSKNESFSLPSSKNISVNITTNISSGVSTTEIEPNISTTNKIVNKFSAENIRRSSLYDEVTEQNTVASSINILSTISEDQSTPFDLLQNEISITTDRNVNIEYHQEKLFTAAQNDIWKENTTPESILVTNSFNDLNENNILPSSEKDTTKSKYESSTQYLPTVEHIFYHQTEYIPTTTETQGYFLKERVVTNINDAYTDTSNVPIFNYESTTESNSNYETSRTREELNISMQNVSETYNYSLSDPQLSMSTASNEYISFKGNPLQNTIYDEINNVSSLPSTVSKSETAIKTLNNETKPIIYSNYTSKYDQNIILTQTESISKTERIETTEFTRDNLQAPTTISPTEFSNQLNLVQNSLLPTLQKPNNFKQFAGDTFRELQANTTNSYSTLHDENPLQSTSTTSIIKNNIQTEPAYIKLPTTNVLSKINRTNDATTKFDININEDIKTTAVNAGNMNNFSPVIDKPVGTHTTIINVSNVATTVDFNSNKEDKTNTEALMYDSEKISTTGSTLVAGKYPSSSDLNVTSNIKILNNFEFRDKTLMAGTTEPYVRSSEITDASLWIFKSITIKDAGNTNIDKSNKINTIITEEKHIADITVPNISTSGGTDVSMQPYNNVVNSQEKHVNSQENRGMYINNDINLRKLSTELKPGDAITEFYVKITQSTPKSIQTQNSTTTMEVVDAIINKNYEKNILTFNNTDITLGKHISDEKLPDVNTVRSTNVNRIEYNNNVGNVNVNSSNKINKQIFKSTNEIDEEYVTTITELVLNGSTSSNLNMDSPKTEKKLIDLNFENVYKAPNNVELNGEELKVDTAVSAINGSQANITPMYESDDISQVNFTDIDNVIQTTDKSIQTYEQFTVKHDKSIADTMDVSFINGTDITVHAHKNILLNETELKTDITEADASSTETSVNSLTTETYYYNKTREMTFIANDAVANDGDIVDIFNDKTLPTMVYNVSSNIRADTNVQQNDTIFEKKLEKAVIITQSNDLKTQMRNNTEVNHLKLNAYNSADVNITIDSEGNIQTNNSINKVEFFGNSTVSDVITESTKIAMPNANIDEIKETTLIAGAAIPDLNFIEENISRQTYNNNLTKQLNIADNIMLDKNLTKDIDKKMQTHYNIDPNETKHMKFSTEASVNSLTTETYYYNKTREMTFIANDAVANDGVIVDINDKTLPTMVYDVSLNIRADTNVQQNDTIFEKKLKKAVIITQSNDLKTQMRNNTEINQLKLNAYIPGNVNITLDSEDNIKTNNSINKVDFFVNSTVSDVITESTIIAMLNPNIDEIKETTLIAGAAIPDLNFTKENINRQTYNNTLTKQLNIADNTMLDKSLTKDIDETMQPHYNIDPNVTKYIKFGLNKTTTNGTKTLSKPIADLNLENYNNSEVNLYFTKDREANINFANSTNKRIQTANTTESKEIILRIYNINATAIDNMQTYNNTTDNQVNFKTVQDLSNNKGVNVNTQAFNKTDAEIRVDITMVNMTVKEDNIQIFNNSLANENITERNDVYIQIRGDTPIESSKLIEEHTIHGFNVTQSTDVDLDTGTTVDLFNIKSSATNQQTYNNTQMQDMIFVSAVTVSNKNEGNTKENNVIKVKRINVQSYPKDTANQTYPKDIENQITKPGKLRSNQTSTTNNNSKMPYISKLEESTSFYPVIVKEIDTNSGEIAKNKPNLGIAHSSNLDSDIRLRNPLDILNSKKSFEVVTLSSSEIKVDVTLKIASDASYINGFTVPSGSGINNSNYNTENTLENLSTKSKPLSKLEFKNGYETLNSNNLLNNKTVSEMNDAKSNFNRIFKTNTTTPSKTKPIEIIDYVKNIKVYEEVSDDKKYIEMPPSNKKKQWIITNTEKSALNQSDYFVQHINVSLPTPFICNVGSRGKYSDKNDCNKFYICIGKLLTPIIGRCPGDTVFSEINKQCTKNLSHCIRNNQFRCLAEGRFIDVLSNNSYYICAKNSKGFVRFKLKCQEGYRLNTDTIQCTIKPSSIEGDSKNTNEKTKEKLSSESDISKKSFACEEEGLFEFPDDFRKYFLCTKKSKSEFRRKIKKCDSDEVFDKDKQKCVDEDSHEEMNGDKSDFNRTFKTNTTTPSFKIEPIEIIDYVKNIKLNEEVSEDNKYLEMPSNNKNKQWIATNTEKSALNQSEYFVQHINMSLPSPFTCNISNRGKYSDKNDCRKFYICIGKLTPIIGRCPSDTVFSEINKQCTKNLSHCIRNDHFRCSAEGRFIDVLSNNSYYICAKNSKGFVSFKLKCQEGYRLNTDTIHCTIKSSSIEDDSENTREKSTKEKLSNESDKSKKSFACEEEGLFEFPDDYRKYFLCTKKSESEFRRKIKKCDSDEVFDKVKQKCVDEDSREIID